jgi:hypothetical protein
MNLLASAYRLRATGAIRLEDRHGIIAFGDKQKLVGVVHTMFPNGGSWSRGMKLRAT